jgi:hypothetical protein
MIIVNSYNLDSKILFIIKLVYMFIKLLNFLKLFFFFYCIIKNTLYKTKIYITFNNLRNHFMNNYLAL